MASQQTRHREDIDGIKSPPAGKLEGLDITVDGCYPEFNNNKLFVSIDESVHEGVGSYLNELVQPGSSVAIAVNPSKKLSKSWTGGKDSPTVAAIVTIKILGDDQPKLGFSIVEGVTKYTALAECRIQFLALFYAIGVKITEIQIKTNIKNDKGDCLLFTVDPDTGSISKPQYEQCRSVTADWMKHAISCGSCSADIISGQSRIICGGCSTEFHWTCMEKTFAETSGGSSKVGGQWLCSGCSSSTTKPPNQPGTGTKKRKRKKPKKGN